MRLRENRPEVIGQAQGHEKRVGHGRAKDRSEHDVARKAGQTRKERVAADGEDTTEHAPLHSMGRRFKTVKSG